jgi:hypothetical protein
MVCVPGADSQRSEEKRDNAMSEEYCSSPSGEVHRMNMTTYSDASVLKELRRAWGSYLPNDPDLKSVPTWTLQDWASFRAITTREARKRGLAIPKELRTRMAKWGVVL